MTGIPRIPRALRPRATDSDLKMDVKDLLGRMVEEDRKDGFIPFMVVGTAGTTAAGVIDPWAELGQFSCKESGVWFHV